MNTGHVIVEDERVAFLRQLLANAKLKRTNKKTAPEVATFASEWEERFTKEIAKLEAEQAATPQSMPEAA